MLLSNCKVYKFTLSSVFPKGVLNKIEESLALTDSPLYKSIMLYDPYGLVNISYDSTTKEYLVKTPSTSVSNARNKFIEYFTHVRNELGVTKDFVNYALNEAHIVKDDVRVWKPRIN